MLVFNKQVEKVACKKRQRHRLDKQKEKNKKNKYSVRFFKHGMFGVTSQGRCPLSWSTGKALGVWLLAIPLTLASHLALACSCFLCMSGSLLSDKVREPHVPLTGMSFLIQLERSGWHVCSCNSVIAGSCCISVYD